MIALVIIIVNMLANKKTCARFCENYKLNYVFVIRYSYTKKTVKKSLFSIEKYLSLKLQQLYFTNLKHIHEQIPVIHPHST